MAWWGIGIGWYLCGGVLIFMLREPLHQICIGIYRLVSDIRGPAQYEEE